MTCVTDECNQGREPCPTPHLCYPATPGETMVYAPDDSDLRAATWFRRLEWLLVGLVWFATAAIVALALLRDSIF
ncbi:MAG: hypothetical protein WC000_12600 [Dokdonella sp.]